MCFKQKKKKKEDKQTTAVLQNTLKLITRCTEKPSHIRLGRSRGHEFNLFAGKVSRKEVSVLFVDGLRSDELIGRHLGL